MLLTHASAFLSGLVTFDLCLIFQIFCNWINVYYAFKNPLCKQHVLQSSTEEQVKLTRQLFDLKPFQFSIS